MGLLPTHIIKTLEDLEHLKALPDKMDKMISIMEKILKELENENK